MSVETKLSELAKQRYKRDGHIPVLERDSAPWKEWLAWRQKNNLPTAFMKSQKKWTVPTEYPPVDLDMALKERQVRYAE